MIMQKQGNKPVEHPKPKSTKDAPLVPEVQKQTEQEKEQKTSETEEDDGMFKATFQNNPKLQERPISSVYPVIDNDLARDNIENDLSDADLQSL